MIKSQVNMVAFAFKEIPLFSQTPQLVMKLDIQSQS